jgi:hypothetical protein
MIDEVAFLNDLLGERCTPTLAGAGPYDIAVNQATLVLEVSLRKRARYSGRATGPNLVSAILNGDPTKALIKVSDDAAEQEGFANLCRGLMQFYRNPTHHDIRHVSREEALAVCLLIDQLIMKFELILSDEEIELILSDYVDDPAELTPEELAHLTEIIEKDLG